MQFHRVGSLLRMGPPKQHTRHIPNRNNSSLDLVSVRQVMPLWGASYRDDTSKMGRGP